MIKMSVQPTRDFDHRKARMTLVSYLKGNSMAIKGCREWARWTYSPVPFWSVWGLVYGSEVAAKFCGLHIYDDGRVEIICGTENLDQWETE